MLDWMCIGFWNWLLCWIWPSHKLYVAEQLSETSQRLRCNKCHRQYAINHDVRAVLAWDDDFERFYQMRRLLDQARRLDSGPGSSSSLAGDAPDHA